MKSIVESVSALVGLSIEEVQRIAHQSPTKYRIYRIPKRSGAGYRVIHHPWKQTKMLQYALMVLLNPSLVPHSAAMAFRAGISSPLLRNAENHAKNSFLVRLDFKDFFPSIDPEDLIYRLTAETNTRPIALINSDRDFLRDVLFVRRPNGGLGLPIGAPSSPLISNGVMFDLDIALENLSAKLEFKYTRYADDLVFSTMRKGASLELVQQVTTKLAEHTRPRLALNPRKTLLMSRKGRRFVTGLFITSDGNVSIGREHKRRIRGLLFRRIHGKLDDKQRASLQGWLAHILDVEPEFLNNLCQKYSSEQVNLALKQVIKSGHGGAKGSDL